jgi:hypothetical protein
MNPKYLAIALGSGKKYGMVIPYSHEQSVRNIKEREILGQVDVLYDGESFDEATTRTSKLKGLDEMMEELTQIDFLR